MSVRHALTEAFDVCMHQGRCRALDIVNTARRIHPELFARESEQLMIKAALRMTTGLMRESQMTEEDVSSQNQLEFPLGILPGFVPPRALAIALPDGEYEWVRYDLATWADLQSALHEKTQNIARAIARQEDHLLKMDTLRPVLAPYPERTVAEGCAMLSKEPPVPRTQEGG